MTLGRKSLLCAIISLFQGSWVRCLLSLDIHLWVSCKVLIMPCKSDHDLTISLRLSSKPLHHLHFFCGHIVLLRVLWKQVNLVPNNNNIHCFHYVKWSPPNICIVDSHHPLKSNFDSSQGLFLITQFKVLFPYYWFFYTAYFFFTKIFVCNYLIFTSSLLHALLENTYHERRKFLFCSLNKLSGNRTLSSICRYSITTLLAEWMNKNYIHTMF